MKEHTQINLRGRAYRTILVMVLLLASRAGFSQIQLGSLSDYALFAGTGALANAGPGSVIIGNIGTNTGAISGYISGTNVTGQIHGTDAATLQGATDVQAAYQSLLDYPTDATPAIAPAMVDETLTPGVYVFGGAASVGGTLTLSGAGTYIFKINGALSVAAASNVILTNGADASKIFWQVYGAATIGANSTFAGTIVADGAIYLADGTTLNGRALATVGAITTYNSHVTVPPVVVPPVVVPPVVVPPVVVPPVVVPPVVVPLVVVNNALAFNGRSNFVALPSGLNTASFTFESWVNYQDNGTWTRIFDLGANENTWMMLTPRSNYYNSLNNIVFSIVTNRAARPEETILSNTPMPTGWHHIAVTLATSGSTTNGTLYLDGVVIGSNTGLTLNPASLGPLTNNWLGRSQYGFDPYLKGSLDEVRFYSTALTQANIQADMFSTMASVPANLTAYYNCDQGTAGGNNAGITTLLDRTANANNGTLTNFALTGTASNWVRSFPTITGITPTFGPAGTSVTVAGTNLMYATGFGFNGTAVTPFTTPTDDLVATVIVPGGATTGAVSVASKMLMAYNGPKFTVITCPLPKAIAQNQTVALTADGIGTLAAAAVNNGSTPANCGVLTYQVQKVVYGEVREHETLTLMAPAGTVFTAVTFASYGTHTGTNGNYAIGGCHASNSQKVVESLILGKNKVTISASNDVFGDPCYGTFKSLAVQAVYTTLAPQVSYTRDDMTGTNYVLLTVTDAVNNKSTATAQITVTNPVAARSALATSAALTAAEVTLYPNPTHAAFTVLVPAVAKVDYVQATLLNTLGQIVRQQTAALPAAGARLVVETADLAAGIYTLRLQMGTTTLAKRVVLQ